MRILEIVSGTARNGAVALCRLLSREMVRAGHHVAVVSRPGSWILDHLPPGVEPVSSSLRRGGAELRRMSRFVADGQYDVIHTHMSSANFFGVLLKYLTGTPSVATAHHQRLQLHWRFNDQVIASSQDTVNFQRRVNWVPEHRLHKVFNFVDVERLRSVEALEGSEVRRQMGVEPSCTVVGYVGDIVERKGLIYLVRAMAGILRTLPQVVLLVIGATVEGGAYERRVRREAERLGLARQMIWAGPRDDIPRMLHAMDIFCLPSLQECMPLGILEAMTVGKPVIATAVGGVSEAVIDGQTGYVVPARSVDPLQSALRTLITQPPLRRQMGRAGWRRIDTEYDPEIQTQKTLEVLEIAASAARRRRAS